MTTELRNGSLAAARRRQHEGPDEARAFWTRIPWIRGDERGRPGLVVQALLISLFLVAYDWLRNFAPSRAGISLSRAGDVLHFERTLGVSPEQALNDWLNGHHTLGLLAGSFYCTAHFLVTLVLLGAVYVAFPGSYRRLRDILVLTNVVGLVGFWLYPLAPPRMLPGFHDTVALTHALGGWSTTLSHNADEYAAMPSLHVGWALWVLVGAITVTRGRRHRAPLVGLAVLHVVLTVLVVLSTGNHFVLDAVAGAGCLAIATAVVSGIGWLRKAHRDRQLA